jgi:hypothetical protein
LTQEQIEATAWLTNNLCSTYGISIDRVLNHEDLNPKMAGEGRLTSEAMKPYLINTVEPFVYPPPPSKANTSQGGASRTGGGVEYIPTNYIFFFRP